jgi:type IV pilus assembly protein PilB
MAIRKLGQIFVDLGFITDDQLQVLLEEQQQQPGALIGRIAEDMALITDDQLAQALAEQMSMKVVQLGETTLPPDVVDKMTETMAQMYRVVPVKFDGHRLTVATCDPQNLTIEDELRTFLGFDIEMVVATERDIRGLMERYYSSDHESVERIVKQLEDDEELFQAAKAFDKDGPFNLTDAEALADSVPVRKLLNMAIFTSSHLKTNSASASKRKVCCMKWFHRHVTWRLRSPRVSKLWPTWILPNAVCLRTVVSN